MAATTSALVLSQAQAAEIKDLLDQASATRRADSHMARARLRSIGYPLAAAPAITDYEALIASGEIRVDETGRARITPQAPGRVFKVSIGVHNHPVDENWWAFNQRYQWLGRPPQHVTSGDHLFALAVDRWGSAVVGLYEAVSPGAQALPGSPDPSRWPLALGVRPLAAIFPPKGDRIPGCYGPQNPVPERVYSTTHQAALYAAVHDSPPAPAPTSVDGRVQEVQWQDVGDDVVEAVYELGNQAHQAAVIDRAIELGGWTEAELGVLAWYTSPNAENSHIRNVVRRAIDYELGSTRRIGRHYGSGPFHVVGDYTPPDTGFGAPYQPVGGRTPTHSDDAVHKVNLDALERGTARHMDMQDKLAAALVARGVQPRRPNGSQPVFDLAFEHNSARYVVEVKSGEPASSQQVRYGVGQVLEYTHLLSQQAAAAMPVISVILIETAPPAPWAELTEHLGIRVLVLANLQADLDALLA